MLADATAGWDKGADGENGAVRFSFGSTDENQITSWRRRFAFTPGKWGPLQWAIRRIRASFRKPET